MTADARGCAVAPFGEPCTPFLYPRSRLMIFAKAPVAGQAKTRLAPVLGAAGAASLHARLVRDTVGRMVHARLCPVELWVSPGTGHPLFAALAAEFGVRVLAQRGADLGARMAHALGTALAGADAAVLIGTDCPGLGSGQVRAALSSMGEADAVLGPVEDGGYVLLGLREAAEALFTDMPWSTAAVAQETRRRMAALGWRWRELPLLWDLDRPEDLARLDAGWLDAAAGPDASGWRLRRVESALRRYR